jgi:hypothetical protein
VGVRWDGAAYAYTYCSDRDIDGGADCYVGAHEHGDAGIIYSYRIAVSDGQQHACMDGYARTYGDGYAGADRCA